jgi:UDP-glucuronate 4-epimerase
MVERPRRALPVKYPTAIGSRMKILVTGAAGFIGFFTARKLLDLGHEVVGLDNLNDYYDPELKKDRLRQIEGRNGFHFVRADLADRAAIEDLFASEKPQRVVHLAAQAGVRHSITHPHDYIASNLTGFLHILEGCRQTGTEHLVYASSSSVYGANTQMPFSEHHGADHPLSLYGATKKSNELMAHSYAHLYRIPVTGLRFFTVYGPWGRPDMALFTFTRKILSGEPIDVYNHGKHARDFTYIDDIVEGIVRISERAPEPDAEWDGSHPDPATSSAPYRVYNIGNHKPVELMDFIAAIEKATGRTAEKNFLPMQPGDVLATYADVDELMQDAGFAPDTPIEEGVQNFVDWYRGYYGV